MSDDPTVIAFDTSGPRCAGALLIGDRIITRTDDMARGQAEHLMPMLEEMLAKEGLVWADIDVIGVGTGPGNFTGIRMSV
ncbi:MAG: tRNA (adenosine(37)-N6)-threonylcarbamoyltransferase complex dimerization subunit type 1 TsaB, partial [Alphaproteobacteria bacterium]|nr:tRNA (adenosine(37)-N6)-threonylcarbamoyltransferase complex dimerization subunit type 1 TsaB [Alphaproteobacteria bacterium]